jgi:predicted metal-dependent phosphoesterase TrpH
MRADLHIHTVASDGCWTPAQVVAEVQARGIGLFAVADHDSIASVSETEALAREAGLAFLRGVEVSTLLDGSVYHILAYGFDVHHSLFTAFLEKNDALLAQAGDDAIRCLVSFGRTIDLDDYAGYEYDHSRGGWKALNFLIDRGFCTDVGDYLRNLAPRLCVEWPSFPHPADAVAAIRKAGGVPILAHPGASLRHKGVSEETLRPFLDFGVAGLECYSQYHDEATTRFCLDWCARNDLLVTGGSDCHGGFVGRELGVPPVGTTDLRLGEVGERIIYGPKS